MIAAVSNIEQVIAEFETARRQMLDEMQIVAIELAMTAVRQVVGEIVEQDRIRLEAIIEAGVRTLDPHGPLQFRLHPIDAGKLQERIASGVIPEFPDAIQIMADSSVARGQVRAESQSVAYLHDPLLHLEELKRLWMEGLPDAQIERRSDEANQRPVKRFPDRRETA